MLTMPKGQVSQTSRTELVFDTLALVMHVKESEKVEIVRIVVVVVVRCRHREGTTTDVPLGMSILSENVKFLMALRDVTFRYGLRRLTRARHVGFPSGSYRSCASSPMRLSTIPLFRRRTPALHEGLECTEGFRMKRKVHDKTLEHDGVRCRVWE